MKVWREVHGVSIRRATILTTTVTVMEMTLLVVIEKTGWNSPQINEVPQTAMRATKKGHDSCNNPSQKPVGITAM